MSPSSDLDHGDASGAQGGESSGSEVSAVTGSRAARAVAQSMGVRGALVPVQLRSARRAAALTFQ
jgi:hypothetical protein